jgi:hypothetical protein
VSSVGEISGSASSRRRPVRDEGRRGPRRCQEKQASPLLADDIAGKSRVHVDTHASRNVQAAKHIPPILHVILANKSVSPYVRGPPYRHGSRDLHGYLYGWILMI